MSMRHAGLLEGHAARVPQRGCCVANCGYIFCLSTFRGMGFFWRGRRLHTLQRAAFSMAAVLQAVAKNKRLSIFWGKGFRVGVQVAYPAANVLQHGSCVLPALLSAGEQEGVLVWLLHALSNLHVWKVPG